VLRDGCRDLSHLLTCWLTSPKHSSMRAYLKNKVAALSDSMSDLMGSEKAS